jgi:hypothetical protein
VAKELVVAPVVATHEDAVEAKDEILVRSKPPTNDPNQKRKRRKRNRKKRKLTSER